MNRRNVLALLAALPAVSILEKAEAAPLKKSFRIVHITDTHVEAEKNSGKHMRACFEKIMAMKHKPDVIFHTGDVIMDALNTDKDSVAAQWKTWHTACAALTIPIRYAIGNHDVWSLKNKGTAPLYEKKWAVEELKLPNRYYSFEQGGWHFIVLDSTVPVNETTYTAHLDDEQFTWLSAELKSIAANKPVMVLSHIPIFSSCIIDWSKVDAGEWKVSGALMHTDSKKLRDLFAQYPNVKTCISGHLHLLDTVIYDGVTYCGTGAVSAYWWMNNKFQRTNAGYAVMDLYADGTFSRYYEDFKW
ncbi:metallophosphoesterase [Mucilaginibacter hurinus]|uniref:Metallophosphoesterase n=1 Tax=Mucilaginibacter hurinus TaxID=2201324 RepID=A0A367GMS3_9SPHI|nr:metallophosphoesterase [Mucilaginibacter hurinus]RCH54774.1 metallophosphoesterase [Mucilaginibacter hurinus]